MHLVEAVASTIDQAYPLAEPSEATSQLLQTASHHTPPPCVAVARIHRQRPPGQHHAIAASRIYRSESNFRAFGLEPKWHEGYTPPSIPNAFTQSLNTHRLLCFY